MRMCSWKCHISVIRAYARIDALHDKYDHGHEQETMVMVALAEERWTIDPKYATQTTLPCAATTLSQLRPGHADKGSRPNASPPYCTRDCSRAQVRAAG